MPTKSGSNEKLRGGAFHHVAIRAKDFDRSLQFYTEGLGFTERMRWGTDTSRAVLLDTGGGDYLEIFERPAEHWADTDPAILHFALRTDDADHAYATAIDAGATSHMEPRDAQISSDPPAVFRIAFVKGPDGELIEFFQHPEL